MSEKEFIENFKKSIHFVGLTTEQAGEAKKLLDKLIAHRDQTVGLWATDLPGMVKDPKKVMFEIKF